MQVCNKVGSYKKIGLYQVCRQLDMLLSVCVCVCGGGGGGCVIKMFLCSLCSH